MIRGLVIAGVWMLCTWGANAGLRGLKTEEPRAFGYFTGDILVRRVSILVDGTTELIRASLPKPGPLTYWLDLTQVNVEEAKQSGERRFTVTLTYQTFYVPYDSKKLTIPSWSLRLAAGAQAEEAAIPAFTFTSSPLRELFPDKSGETAETILRPDGQPHSFPTQLLLAALMGSATVALLSLILLARHLAWGPFKRRARRPFTRAARLIARYSPEGCRGGGDGAEALLLLHRAFDETLGQRMLAEDLGRFLVEHPEHAGCQAGIAQFFECSRRTFFAGIAAEASERETRSALLKLSRALAAGERKWR